MATQFCLGRALAKRRRTDTQPFTGGLTAIAVDDAGGVAVEAGGFTDLTCDRHEPRARSAPAGAASTPSAPRSSGEADRDRGTPESVGMSTARLARLTGVFQKRSQISRSCPAPP